MSDTIDFTRITNQEYYFSFIGRIVTVQYKGCDPITGVTLYGFAEPDVDEDPRGPLGEHAVAYLEPEEYGMTGGKIGFSWMTLNNDQRLYQRALLYAKQKWNGRTSAIPTPTVSETTFSDDIFDVLTRAHCVDKRLLLPSGKLKRKLYVQINEILERMGGKWKGGKVQAHIFESDPAPMLAEVLATRMIPPKNPLAFFRTSPETINLMLSFLPFYLKALLEPSAGDGAILRALRERYPQASLEAVEIDPRRAEQAEAAVPTAAVTAGNFLWYTSGPYDGIVMNPPFATERDAQEYVAHIDHALDLLQPLGWLVSIAPAGLIYNSFKRITALRARLEAWHAHIEDLPRDAFKDSGTNVATVLIAVQRPQEGPLQIAVQKDNRHA